MTERAKRIMEAYQRAKEKSVYYDEEWCYTMRSEDGEFFNYLQSDYVRYEQEMYYQDTP